MQQTTKYKFNLIETSDTFSPDALNANAQAVEDALITHEAAVDGALKSQKLEWQAADDALKAADTALAQADSAIRAEFAAAAAADKSALQASITSLQTALGSGGSNARITSGTYKGNGKYGSSSPNSLTLAFTPYLVFVTCNTSTSTSGGGLGINEYCPTVMVRNATAAHGDRGRYLLTVSWSGKTVSWYCAYDAVSQNNENGTTYYYVAVGA